MRTEGPGPSKNRFEIESLRRIQDGIISFSAPRYLYFINDKGFISFFIKSEIEGRYRNNNSGEPVLDVIIFTKYFIEMYFFFLFVIEYYQRLDWEGNIRVEFTANNIKGYKLNYFDVEIDTNKSIDSISKALYETNTLSLKSNIVEIISQLLLDISWPFNQYVDNIIYTGMHDSVLKLLKDHNLIK